MTIALWCVFVAGLMPYVAAVLSKAGGKDFDNDEPRAWQAKQTGRLARANAAQQNSFEAFAFFAAAVVIAHVVRGPQSLVDILAVVFVAARVAYLGAYLAGKGTLRSLLWTVGFGATAWIFLTAA